MPFGIGGSSSRSSSSSSSSSFDNLDQSSFNFGTDASRSVGGSQSSSRIAFEDIFSKLFGGASDAAGAVNTGGLVDAANTLFSSGTNFLENLGGGGAGRDFLASQLEGGSSLVDSQIGQLSTDIGKFLSETVNPNITAGGVAAGTLGGSRGEVQRGLASEAALSEFVRGSTSIRAGERDRLTGIASGIMGSDADRNSSALSLLPQLFGLAEGGAYAGLSPFAMLSQIIGGPTVLTDSTSSQLAESMGLSVGGAQTTGRAASQSESESTSKSSSFSLGM